MDDPERLDDPERSMDEPQVVVAGVSFTIAIDSTNEHRHVRAQTGTGRLIEIGWYQPVGEALAVYLNNGEWLGVCADDSRALMTLVEMFAQAMLSTPDEEERY